jgi:hypothetical protein
MKPMFYGQLLISFTVSLSVHAGPILNNGSVDLKADNCVSKNIEIANKLKALQITDYQRLITEHGHNNLLSELWADKVEIHNKLREFYRDNGLKKDCADSARSAFFEIRNSEDIIEEDLFRKRDAQTEYADNPFKKNNPQIKRHPKAENFDFQKDLKSGDLILSRGKAYTSAAISSLGEFDTQFSHLSVVYRDDLGKLWTVESHIEVGAFVRPFKDHIKDKNFRSMIFRFDDEYTAYEAAKFIFYKVKNASDTTGNIFYDFAFDQESSKNLFCSEIASHAFDYVSHELIKLPMFRSKLQSRKTRFVKKLGIKAMESFIPADIEVDPRFKMIGEWKNAANIADNLEKDAVLRAMYEWNDKYGYELVQGKGKAFVYRNIAWPLRRVPFLKKYFKNKLPINMTRELIGYFGVLESVGELLQKKLKVKEIEAINTRGMPLLNSEKFNVLEDFRIEDMGLRKTKFHKMYKPSLK